MENLTAFWKSLMKIIKTIEANIDPWVTPILIGLSEDRALLILVCCFLSPMNDYLAYSIVVNFL